MASENKGEPPKLILPGKGILTEEKIIKMANEQEKIEEHTKEIVMKDFGSKVVESVEDGFLICNSGNVHFAKNVIDGDILYISKKQEPYRPYTLPKSLSNQDIVKLYNDVYSVVEDFLDIEDDYKHLITIAIFFSYQQHKSTTTPYLYASGEKGSGKSRLLEIFEELGYRPMMATAISGANILTYLAEGTYGCPCGIILDDEVKESIDNDSDKRGIYLTGYRRSGKVPKTRFDSNGKRIQDWFFSFSLKVFASKLLVDNDQLIDRSILPPMVKGKPKFGGFTVDGTDNRRFQEIRGRLLLWKLYTYYEQFTLERPTCRDDEIFFPLLKTAKFLQNDKAYQAVLRISKKDKTEKEESMRGTLEAKLLIAIIKVNQVRRSETMPFADIFGTLSQVVNGRIEEGKIKSGDYGELSTRKIGGIITNIFKAETRVAKFEGKNQTMRIFKKDVLEKMVDVYGITQEDTNK